MHIECDLGKTIGVATRVMGAEEQGSGFETDAHICLRAAGIATVLSGQLGFEC